MQAVWLHIPPEEYCSIFNVYGLTATLIKPSIIHSLCSVQTSGIAHSITVRGDEVHSCLIVSLLGVYAMAAELMPLQ